MKRIVLASKSPRRKELLENKGIKFEVIKSNYKEEKNDRFNQNFIKKISYCKAQDVAQSIDFDAVVISADTIVILDSVCLNKPRNFNEALFCLKKLSDRWHSVITAVTVMDKDYSKTELVETKVKFRKVNDEEIKNYIEKFEPFDKAGSYGIQDFVSEKDINNPPKTSFIEKIEGPYDNVVGLPVDKVVEMLKEINAF